MMPIINKIYSIEEKEYYIYIPGTTHYDEDRFGNPVFVKDYYYLDEEFNRLVMQCDISNVNEFADKFLSDGKDVVVGSCAPFYETRHGDFTPYSNPNVKGIWERPTKEQLLKYRTILDGQKENKVKQLA